MPTLTLSAGNVPCWSWLHQDLLRVRDHSIFPETTSWSPSSSSSTPGRTVLLPCVPGALVVKSSASWWIWGPEGNRNHVSCARAPCEEQQGTGSCQSPRAAHMGLVEVSFNRHGSVPPVLGENQDREGWTNLLHIERRERGSERDPCPLYWPALSRASDDLCVSRPRPWNFQ